MGMHPQNCTCGNFGHNGQPLTDAERTVYANTIPVPAKTAADEAQLPGAKECPKCKSEIGHNPECPQFLLDTLMANAQMGVALVEALVKICELREGLRTLQWRGNDSGHCPHEEVGGDHELQCTGCGKWKCEGCEPDCWLAALVKEK